MLLVLNMVLVPLWSDERHAEKCHKAAGDSSALQAILRIVIWTSARFEIKKARVESLQARLWLQQPAASQVWRKETMRSWSECGTLSASPVDGDDGGGAALKQICADCKTHRVLGPKRTAV